MGRRAHAVLIVSVVFAASCSGGGSDRPIVEGSGMTVGSADFGHGEPMPVETTCDGSDVSPSLTLRGIPDGAVSLALLVDDPDAPGGWWAHWVAFNIPVTTDIPRGVGSLGVDGANSWGSVGYGGPCPPSGTHRYHFTVFAVDAELDLRSGASRTELLEALEGHVLAEATLTGTYARAG